MDVTELQSLKIKDLTKVAKDLGVESISGLNKQELIVAIIKAEEKKEEKIYSSSWNSKINLFLCFL